MKAVTSYYDATVVGAGVIGASIAYHLSVQGMRVLVIDAKGPYAKASGACDGALSVATKKKGPMVQLAAEALQYVNRLSEDGQPLSQIYHNRPSYYFSTQNNEVEEAALDELSKKLSALKGIVSIKRDLSQGSHIPGLGESVGRLIEVSGEGHMLGYLAVDAFLSKTNLDCRWPCQLQSFESEGEKVRIKTSIGEIVSSTLILATGVNTGKFIPELPIFPRGGQIMITDRALYSNPLPGALTSASYLINKASQKSVVKNPPIVIDPLLTGQFLIGSSRVNNGDEDFTDFLTIKRLLNQAVQCYTPIRSRRVLRVFVGVRAAVEDGLPIVGELPDSPGIVVASGFEGDGICLSALVGREVSRLVNGKSMIADLSPLSINRFFH